MIRYVCDSCGRLKKEGETWILGLAAEVVAVTIVRREINILPTWDEFRAVDPLAVHFCSEKCKDKYMAQLFGATD